MGCTVSHPTHPTSNIGDAAPLASAPSSSTSSLPSNLALHTSVLSPLTAASIKAEGEDRRSSISRPQPRGSSPLLGATRTATVHPSTVTLLPPSPSPTAPSRSSTSSLSSPSAPPPPPAIRYQHTPSILGKGHFARVTLAVDTHTGAEVAIKIIDKKEMTKNRSIVESELSILKRMGRHRHIVSLLDFYEDDKKFYIVMELCSGGDLFSRIVEQGKYSEAQAVRCCRQIAEALVYIHSCGITHRDLKPENILLLDSAVDADLKIAGQHSTPSSALRLTHFHTSSIFSHHRPFHPLPLVCISHDWPLTHLRFPLCPAVLSDFGLSKILPNVDDVMRTVCGTWAYCAPEVISHRSYTSKVDNWTLGVLMYILLCGYHPFDCYGDLPEPDLLDKIMRVDYEFEDPVWDDVSKHAKSLIKQLLVYAPDERLSLSEFLNSPWIQSGGSTHDLTIVRDRLSKFTNRTFRALVTAKVAIKKFRQSISRSPRTPSGTRGGGGMLGVGGKVGGGEEGEEGECGEGVRGEGSLSGLPFLQRLDKKDVRGSGSLLQPSVISVSGGAEKSATVKEKGGLGRGTRISEEDQPEVYHSEEEEDVDAV